MRVAVIRGDVPSPIFLSDLEPTSQFNPPTEPFGQTRYIEYASAPALTNLLAGVYSADAQGKFVGDVGDAVNDQFIVSNSGLLPIPKGANGYKGVPAGVESSAAITFPVTVSGLTLKFKNTVAAGLTTVTLTGGPYATMAALLVQVNTQLALTGFATATTDPTGTLLVIQSTVPGVGSYIDVDATGTANTNLNLAAPQPAATFTMPSAATIIAALNPVATPPATGSLNVSTASLVTNVGASPNNVYVANFIAPQFQETETAVQSYQVGVLAGYLKLSWNPDSRLLPAITSGPAIQVVENDGTTPFSSSGLAPLPMITGAVHNSPNTGDITISGQGLGNVEFFGATTVTVTGAPPTTYGPGSPRLKLTQSAIISTVADGVPLTGLFDVTEGSATVTATLSQAVLLFASNVIVFESQPDTIYTVSTVVTTTITLTTPYTGISNAYTTADTIKTQGSVSATSIVIPADLLKTVEGVALGVAGSTVEVKYGSLANTNYGTAATVSAFAPLTGWTTLTGLTNQMLSQVGPPNSITISGAASPGNNGTFPIVAYVSATSIKILNYNGVAGDANNGSIVWSEKIPVAFLVT
jgi:hypothetical protein